MQSVSRAFCLDTETTSVNKNEATMLSLGGLIFNVDNMVPCSLPIVVDRYFATVREVPSDASRVNGLTRSKLHILSGGKALEEQYDSLRTFLYSNYIAIGYNVDYDISVITNNVMRVGWPKPIFSSVIDVLGMVRKLDWDEKPFNFKLETVYNHVIRLQGSSADANKKLFASLIKRTSLDRTTSIGDIKDEAHNAAWDAYMTYRVYKFIIDYAQQRKS